MTKFCHNGPCLEKMFFVVLFWLRSNSNQAVQDIEDGLKFCSLMTQFCVAGWSSLIWV